jgi:hypothetical protein
MLKKTGILRRNKGLEDESRDLPNGNNDAFLNKELTDELLPLGVNVADDGGIVIPEGVNPRKAMGEIEIDPRGSDAQHQEEDPEGNEDCFDILSLAPPHVY